MNIKEDVPSIDTIIKINEEYKKTIKELFRRITFLENKIKDKNKIIKQADREIKRLTKQLERSK